MSGYYKRIPGFYQLNGYAWDYFAGRPLHRLEMLFFHARFIPHVIRDTWSVWRWNRLDGPGTRWEYPWERRS